MYTQGILVSVQPNSSSNEGTLNRFFFFFFIIFFYFSYNNNNLQYSETQIYTNINTNCFTKIKYN